LAVVNYTYLQKVTTWYLAANNTLLEKIQKKQCPTLQSMKIWVDTYSWKEQVFSIFLPETLTELDMREASYVDFPGFTLPDMKISFPLPHLTRLTLSLIHVSLWNFSSLHSLKHVHLERCKIRDYSWLETAKK